MSINGKKVLAITLARGGSKSIPGKNIMPLAGRPLLQYTTDEVAKSQYIDAYYVSTDSDDIKAVCESLNVEVIDRPAELASDTAKSSDALIHAVGAALAIEDAPFDIVVEVMATNPLKVAEDIDGCIAKLVELDVGSVVSVTRLLDHHPSRIKYIIHDKLYDFYPEVPESRRQDLTPAAFVRNGSVYAMTRDFLASNSTRYNKETYAYIMPPERYINIDDPADLFIASTILECRSGAEPHGE